MAPPASSAVSSPLLLTAFFFLILYFFLGDLIPTMALISILLGNDGQHLNAHFLGTSEIEPLFMSV